jgi:outer membrane protein assembly factor BamB
MRTPSGPRFRHSRGLVLLAALAIPATVGVGCGSTSTPPVTAAPLIAVQPAATPASSNQPQPLVGGDWSGFRGDASRIAVGVQGPTGNPVLNWRFKAGGGVPNNIAIVGDTVYFASDDGVVHAVSRTSGSESWQTKLQKPSVRGPVAADARVYLADEGGTVLALDPSKAGARLWQSTTTYDGTTEMLSVGGSLYFGTGDGFLVALDAATGAEQWKVQMTPSAASVHNPAHGDGLVFAGTDGGGFVAVDVAARKIAWTGDLNGDDTGTASVAGGIAYIGTGADATKGILHAFDAKTGQALWTGPAPMLTTPNVIDGVAFSSTMQGRVVSMDAKTGALRWSIQLSGKIRPMAVVGSTLYISADTEKRVYAVETATGNKLWQFDVDDASDCCIAVAKGSVFLGTLSGSVYSIGGDGAQIAAQPFATSAPSTAPAAGTPPTTLAAKVTWATDLRQMQFAPISQIAIDPMTGRIWAPEANGDKIAIFDANGKLLEEWGKSGTGSGQFDFTRANGDGYGTLAFARDGSFFVLDAGNRRVQHFDAHRTFLGQWGAFGNGPGQLNDPVGIAVAPDGSVWIVDNRRQVAEHVDARGKVLGSFNPFASLSSSDGANSLAIDGKGNLYVSSAAPSKVLVFDRKGTLLRTVGDGAFAEQATHMAIDGAGRLFVTQGPDRGDAPGILAFGPDGSLLGGFGPVGDGDGQLVFPAGIALDDKGGIYVEDSVPESARMIRFELPAGVR